MQLVGRFAALWPARYKPRVPEFEALRDVAWVERVALAFQVTLPIPVRDRLCAYLEQTALWKQRVNLTGARGAEALCEILLGDGFALAQPGLVAKGARVIDVGSGVGAPIVPLLLLRSELSAVCCEPLHVRAAFLRTLSVRLGLIERMRVEEQRLDPERPAIAFGAFDVALSRATFAPERWLGLGLELAPQVLVLTAAGEPPPAPAHARLLDTRRYRLPFSDAPRRVSAYGTR